MKLTKLILLFALASLLFNCGGNNLEKADLVFINGKVVTMDGDVISEAIAVKGDTILAIGYTDDIEDYIGDSTKTIDLEGKFLMPGFYESHAHFLGLGHTLMILDLTTAKNWDEVVAMVAKAADNSTPGEWIVGRGWHQEKFDPKPEINVEGYPVHEGLSKASKLNPVMLSHASGHAVFANKRAMDLAGINKSTADPAGGKIVRDSLGNAIGVFEENAELLISKIYDDYKDKWTDAQKRDYDRKGYLLASEECMKRGITSFYDAGSTFDEIDLLKVLVDSSLIDVRLDIMLHEPNDILKKKIADYKIKGYGKNHLTVNGIKKYADGALGSRGAWMLEPYDDLPGAYGQNVTWMEELKETAQIAKNNGFQLMIHAIGDRANREVLNLYESVLGKDSKNYRWRIEHAQHLNPADIGRFGELGVIAAMQSIHCTSDASFVVKRIGEKRAEEGAYIWRKLTDSGAIICNGTDSPIEKVNPIPCFYAAVTRSTSDGSLFYPAQKLTRQEALKTYTINGAYAAFEEDIKGSLKPGKLADFVVLSNDILKCSEDDILNTRVLYTVVGGEIKYKQK